MSIRCVCVDDEPLARRGIHIALAPYSDFELVGEFSSADELLRDLPKDVDVAFLDIEMPRKDGFALLQEWPEPKPAVVFVTAYSEHAVKAFENSALDYILKPIQEDRFSQLIEKIRKGIGRASDAISTKELLRTIDNLKSQLIKSDPEVTIKTDDGYSRVRLSDVIYIEGIGDHVCFHLKNRQLITRSTLKKYLAELEGEDFLQIHKSFLVNAKHVEHIERRRFGDYQISLTSKKELKLSRRYKPAIERFTKN